jgi:hypothetical protein
MKELYIAFEDCGARGLVCVLVLEATEERKQSSCRILSFLTNSHSTE